MRKRYYIYAVSIQPPPSPSPNPLSKLHPRTIPKPSSFQKKKNPIAHRSPRLPLKSAIVSSLQLKPQFCILHMYSVPFPPPPLAHLRLSSLGTHLYPVYTRHPLIPLHSGLRFRERSESYKGVRSRFACLFFWGEGPSNNLLVS